MKMKLAKITSTILTSSLPALMLATGQLIANSALADVRLPKLVGDHMVLQRDSKIAIWGWADPGQPVRIDFHGRRGTTRTDQNGRWSMSLGPFPAGGPYELVIVGKNTITIHDVLVGDVWVASGQSNMEFPLRPDRDGNGGVVNSELEVADSSYPQLRLFKVHHRVGFRPADDVEADTWTASTARTVSDFSAVAFLFGRELHLRYRIPIGLIETSWGGTAAEVWVSAEGLRSFPEFRNDIKALRQADDRSVRAEYDRYLKLEAEWNRQHATEDRGTREGRALWAAPALDISTWPTITEPQPTPNEKLGGFDGVVWFRREITISPDVTGQRVRVHLSTAGKTDRTYFNGREIGHTEGWDKARNYLVPADAIRGGRNVVVVRMTGEDGYVGMSDSDMYVEIGGTSLPLAGPWAYQPGPDLTHRPIPSALSKQIDGPNKATVLFNGMISPLLPFRIKGVIWYQGEKNAMDNRSVQYRTLFPALIGDWRAHWGYEFPFLFVQLAGFGHNEPEPADYQWSELREAQSMALAVPLTGMATAVDVGDENDVHPRDKQDVAHRLVLAAAKVAYGENLVYSGPTYQSIQLQGSRARIHFAHLGTGLLVKDKYGYVRGFEVAGPDGKFVWAQARQDGSDILVFNAAIQHPTAVRYDWSNTPDGNLYNEEGLPAPPFRTDAPRP